MPSVTQEIVFEATVFQVQSFPVLSHTPVTNRAVPPGSGTPRTKRSLPEDCSGATRQMIIHVTYIEKRNYFTKTKLVQE